MLGTDLWRRQSFSADEHGKIGEIPINGFMKKELEQQLISQYPQLFADYGKSPEVTCMTWGCCISDGWFGIMKEICERLDVLREKSPDLRFAQVKEKFGLLRVYMDGVSDEVSGEVYDIIEQGEKKSSQTCEYCGSTEGVTLDAPKGYWVKTLCHKCMTEQRKGESDFEQNKEKARAILIWRKNDWMRSKNLLNNRWSVSCRCREFGL